MAFIKCSECGRDVSTPARVCPQCGFPLVQSQINADTTASLDTNSETSNTCNVGKQQVSRKANSPYVKSFLGVIVLIVITLGIYLWVYLFKVLSGLQDKVSYRADDFFPAKAKPILGWLVFLVYAIWIVSIVFLAPLMGRELKYILSLATTAISIGIGAIMILVLSISQERVGIRPFNKTIAWTLLAVGSVLGLISEMSVAIAIGSWICNLAFFYIIVSQSNRIFEREKQTTN